jgi:hypothetical protein
MGSVSKIRKFTVKINQAREDIARPDRMYIDGKFMGTGLTEASA